LYSLAYLEKYSFYLRLSFGVLLIWFLSIYSAADTFAQNLRLEVHLTPSNPALQKKIRLAEKYPDSVSLNQKVAQVMAQVRQNGYLLAESHLLLKNSLGILSVTLNNQFHLSAIANGNIASSILQDAGFSERLFSGVRYNPTEIESLIDRVLKSYQDNGYPFAEVFLDSVRFDKNQISAKLYSSPGLQFQFDTLQIVGNVKISKAFLQSFFDIKTGALYNESRIQTIEEKLQGLNFVLSAKKPEVTFFDNKASLTLYLNKQKASQFDGILGFLPDNRTGKLQLTGDIRLHLQNAFKRAEILKFNFKGLPSKSRELDLGAGLSELFSSPLGAELSFNLFKQDTNFQNVNFRAGLSYRTSRGVLSAFLSTRSGAPVASVDTLSASVPLFANVNVVSYGAGWRFNSLDFQAVPTRGILVNIEAEAGRKEIKASSIPPEAWDSVQFKSSQYRVSCNVQMYTPLSKRSVLKFGNQTDLLMGRSFFENELYRLGGFGSIRGFDEQSILATNYSIFSGEYRLLIGSKSFLFAFINQGFVRKSIIKETKRDSPFGFGAGLTLETKAGMFSLSYALGKQKDNPLNLQSGKIHFGLVTLF